MLKVEHLSTGYGKKQVLFDVSFEVKQGEIALLIGSNGSGKSTVLKTIYGMRHDFKGGGGTIDFENEDITNVNTSDLLKKGLLYIPQKNNLFEDLTVKENLEMAGMTIDQKRFKIRLNRTLDVFSFLTPMLKKTPMKLSGGERQLLTLAMATLHEPKMIMIDEPFAGLSPQNIAFVTEKLEKMYKDDGITLLIVEHRIGEIIRIVNRLISLKYGSVFSNLITKGAVDLNTLDKIFL